MARLVKHEFEHGGKTATIEVHENVNTGELQQLENAERERLDAVAEAEATAKSGKKAAE